MFSVSTPPPKEQPLLSLPVQAHRSPCWNGKEAVFCWSVKFLVKFPWFPVAAVVWVWFGSKLRLSWHFWDWIQARGRRKRRRKRGEKRWEEIKGGEKRKEKKKVLFNITLCVFPRPGKHINPSASTLGNKETKPDCGGKGDKKDPGTRKGERARFRNSWDSTLRGVQRCRPAGGDWHSQTHSPSRSCRQMEMLRLKRTAPFTSFYLSRR